MVGGTCYIWQETYKNKENNNQIEMQHFIRWCDVDDTYPLNQWSQVSSKSDNLYLCGSDNCNGADLEGNQDSSALSFGLFALICLFI